MAELGFAPGGAAPGGRPALVSDRAMLPIELEINQIQSQYGYGEVWGRPGLPLKLRSLLTVALLTALGLTNELETHINNALHIGVTPEEIHETLLHAGVYGGLPSWNTAANVARKVFVERGVLPAD